MSWGAVDKLGGSGTSGGGAVSCSEVVEMERVVIVVVDVVVDGCDIAVDACDIDCDEGTGGKVSVGNMEGLGSGISWNELVLE